MYRLDVYYDLDRGEDDKLHFRDEEIEEIAGVKLCGSGCGTCMVRDVELHFPTEEARSAARNELREAGFRFAAMCGAHPKDKPGP